MLKHLAALSALISVLSLQASGSSDAGSHPPFAQKFLWGVANAAFQVEGSPVESDWTSWMKTPGKIEDGSNAQVATDFWHRYAEDFGLAQELGANAFRISIAWERIEPEKGKFDQQALLAYGRMIVSMREHGLEPVVTLHHFVLPKWVSDVGGLLAPDFATYFSDYAQYVVDHLSRGENHVSYWMTFNEPNVLPFSGYYIGDWPPGIKGDLNKMFASFDAIIKAHRQAYVKIRNLKIASVKVGIAHHWRDMQARSNSPIDWVAKKIGEKYFNSYITDGIMRGKRHLDFIGINYYGREMMSLSTKSPYLGMDPGNGPRTDLGWEIYPQGLERVLVQVNRAYHLPIIVSENGLADRNDAKRSQFITDHVRFMMNAKRKGVNVFGYLHWSLTDNFEWARGLTPRFGLVEINYANLQRIKRPSFYVYQKLIKETVTDAP